MEKNKVVEYMKQMGIKNPEKPSEKEIQKLLGMMLKSKDDVEIEFFKSYFTSMSSVGSAVIKGLKGLADAHVSKEYIDSVNKVINQLNKDYENAKSEEEKEKVYYRIIQQLDRIKQESKDHRDFLKQLGLYASGTAVLIAGIAVAVRKPEVGREMVRKGIEVFKG
ncbi:hypothetical protein [Virgibacillus litoralis]|uniref:DUF1641 domain-containing protein n=1 Tax=Virgibacillus litoralis TaxID=578221 RepID=A0ABS4HEL9_9BACI|nr:hypothetical protein [Virgibacillus litoralis]MBP1949380.1 hypothetical protein [Virgibacillus litoralis]